MVGDDQVDVAVASACHRASRLAASRIGGQHLSSVAPSGIVRGVEVQVVRAGLHRHVDAVGPGRAQRRHGPEALRCTTWARAPVRAGGVDDERDRRAPPRRRPAARKPAYAAPWAHSVIASASSACTTMSAPSRATSAIAAAKLGGVEVRELLDAGVEQEALEAEDAGVVERREVGDVARDRAAPEADVDPGLAGGDRALGLERGDRRRRRDAVERHVDDRRDAAGRGGAGRAGEALPLGAAGLVDVHVRVDEAGQQHLVVGELDTSAPAASASYAPTATTTPSRDDGGRGARRPSTTARPARRTVVSPAMLSCPGRSSSRRG